MAGVEANQRLVNPLPSGSPVVHVLEFGYVQSQRIGVAVDDARLPTSCRTEVNIVDGPLAFKGNGLPILFADHQVGQAVFNATFSRAHRKEQITQPVPVDIAASSQSETEMFAGVPFCQQLPVGTDARGRTEENLDPSGSVPHSTGDVDVVVAVLVDVTCSCHRFANAAVGRRPILPVGATRKLPAGALEEPERSGAEGSGRGIERLRDDVLVVAVSVKIAHASDVVAEQFTLNDLSKGVVSRPVVAR